MARHTDRSRDHFLLIGHRGSPRRHRENTIDSLRAALESGADGIETDLRRTSDGVVVLHHDADVGGRLLSEMSFAELRAADPAIAKLEDLGDLRGRGTLVLEIKESGFEDDLARAIDRWPDVILCSFDHDIVERLAVRGARYEWGLTVRNRSREYLDRTIAIRARWFFPKWDCVDRRLVERFTSAGVRVVPWSANRSSQWRRLRSWGCAGVMTDVPHPAVMWRDEDRG